MVVAMLSDLPNFQTFYHHWCYAPRSADHVSSFYHHWCYALRSSLQSPNAIDATDLQVSTIIDATLKDLLDTFYPHWGYVFKCLFIFSHCTIIDATALRSLLFNSQTRLMLRFKLFSTIVHIPEATFKIFSSSFNHQWCYALRLSLQFSNIIDATL